MSIPLLMHKQPVEKHEQTNFINNMSSTPLTTYESEDLRSEREFDIDYIKKLLNIIDTD